MRKWPLMISSAILSLSAATGAGASCGSANCFLVTGTQEGMAPEGRLVMDLSYRFIPADQPQEGSDETAEAITAGIDFAGGAIDPGHHQEIRTNNELLQMDLGYGLAPRWTLGLTLPLVNNRHHEHYHLSAGGKEFRREDYTGFGDVRLGARYAAVAATKHLLALGAALKAPTGEYKLLNTEGEISEPTIMPGTGSWDEVVSAYYEYQIRPYKVSTFVSGSYQFNGENDLDYRFGDTLMINAGMTYAATVHERRFTTSVQINARQSPHDEYRGAAVPSTGGTWVYLTPGLQVQVSDTTSLYTHLQLPIYQEVNDANLVPRYGFILGASFNL